MQRCEFHQRCESACTAVSLFLQVDDHVLCTDLISSSEKISRDKQNVQQAWHRAGRLGQVGAKNLGSDCKWSAWMEYGGPLRHSAANTTSRSQHCSLPVDCELCVSTFCPTCRRQLALRLLRPPLPPPRPPCPSGGSLSTAPWLGSAATPRPRRHVPFHLLQHPLPATPRHPPPARPRAPAVHGGSGSAALPEFVSPLLFSIRTAGKCQGADARLMAFAVQMMLAHAKTAHTCDTFTTDLNFSISSNSS